MNGSRWVTDNYTFLETWSKRWSPTYWDELISFYCLYIDSNWTKFSAIPDGDDRLRFTQTWFKNNVGWKNSDFNKAIRVNSIDEEYDIPDIAEESFIEVTCETDREDIKEFMLDLNKRFSEYDVNRIMLMRKIYIGLETHERVLYDMYFTQMLSMRAIGKKIDLPLSAVFNMLNDLKIKLKLCAGI
jgi:DNA-directed RNA polymerase specialized sigma subunit